MKTRVYLFDTGNNTEMFVTSDEKIAERPFFFFFKLDRILITEYLYLVKNSMYYSLY